MVEPSHQITFAGSPGKRRHGLIIAGLLAVVGAVALLSAGPGLPDGVMIGGLALVLAAGFAVHVLRSTGDSGAILTIDRDGVWFRDWGLPKVPWRHVAGIHVAGIRLHLIIRIDLIDGEAFLAGLDEAQRRTTSSLVRPDRLAAPAGAFQAPIGDVVVALREAHEAAASMTKML